MCCIPLVKSFNSCVSLKDSAKPFVAFSDKLVKTLNHYNLASAKNVTYWTNIFMFKSSTVDFRVRVSSLFRKRFVNSYLCQEFLSFNIPVFGF